jgi:hypothetical protein
MTMREKGARVTRDGKKDAWDRLTERLRSTAESGVGPMAIDIVVLVVDGVPQHYTRPRVRAIEPRRRVDQLLRYMSFGIVDVGDDGEVTGA